MQKHSPPHREHLAGSRAIGQLARRSACRHSKHTHEELDGIPLDCTVATRSLDLSGTSTLHCLCGGGPPKPAVPGGGAKALLIPARSSSSLSGVLASVFQVANHFAKPAVNSSRVRFASLSASNAFMNAGARNVPAPKLRGGPPGPPPGPPGPPRGAPPKPKPCNVSPSVLPAS